ncbi:unnamed protein product [Lepidochelys olivacea]
MQGIPFGHFCSNTINNGEGVSFDPLPNRLRKLTSQVLQWPPKLSGDFQKVRVNCMHLCPQQFCPPHKLMDKLSLHEHSTLMVYFVSRSRSAQHPRAVRNGALKGEGRMSPGQPSSKQ